MPALSLARAANATFSPSYFPVAIFVGGTSGVGQGLAQAFARYTKGNAHIILIGRNRAAAESIIASFPKPRMERAQHEFVQCDVSLMRNIQATTSELLARLPKLNFLVVSPGILNMKGRDETEEGIDRRLALHYYARWKFIYDLLPLLKKAKASGEDAKVMTTLSPIAGGAINLDDLGLKKRYTAASAGLASPTYNDLMVESFAEQCPDIAFTHIFPGIVRTPLIKATHWALRPFNPLFEALLYPVSVSAEDCAEYLLWGLFEGEKGAFRRDNHGEDIGKQRYHGSEEARKRLWEHTVQEIDRAINS